MAEPTLDSLSSQPQPDGAAGHIEVPPIGPAPGMPGEVGAAPSPAPAPTPPADPSPPPGSLDALSPAAPPTPPDVAPSPSSAPAQPPARMPSAESLSGIAEHPVIETHRGAVPIRPLPGAAPPAPGGPQISGTTRNVDTPWAQRPVYLWLLLFLGFIFLFLLAFVYFGGVYKQD